MVRGFDASSVQGVLPFDKLEPALRFAILKAQQGNDGFDPSFETNMRAGLAAGLEVFAYCFAYPLPFKAGVFGRNPKEQARLCVERVYRFPEMRGRPIFVDLEWPEPTKWSVWGVTAQSISAWCKEFCEEIERLAGMAPIIYTYPDWWEHVSAADVSWAARYGLWLARYPGRGWPREDENPAVPYPWTEWLFWQFDGNGGLRLPNGVDADFCVFNGNEEALWALAHQTSPVDWDVVHTSPYGEP